MIAPLTGPSNRTRLPVLLLATLLVACAPEAPPAAEPDPGPAPGTLEPEPADDPPPAADDPDETPPKPVLEPEAEPDPEPDEPAAACPTPPRMRRLNRREYLATIADLFPGVPLPRLDVAPDPRDVFDNDADALAPSALLVDQYAQAALDISAGIEQHIDLLVQCDHADPWCPRDFIDTFGRRIYRRPIDDAEHEFLLGLYFDWGEGDFVLGIQAMVQAMLQSPTFLYRIEDAGPCHALTPYETATRLSYALWGTMPDDALLDAARDGDLDTGPGLRHAVVRMAEDPRFEERWVDFFRQWMDLDRLERAAKAPEDGFDEAARSSYRAEMEDFARQLLHREGTLTDLLTSRVARVDARMAALYGVDPPPAGETAVVELPRGREGFLNRGAFLAARAHPFETSPILRGVFVLERLLCIELGEQPADSLGDEAPREAEGRPLTTRERTEAITGRQPCSGCHSLINPIGFAFEHFDTLGRTRYTDLGQRIDPRGHLPDGRPFGESVELAELLAADEAVAECFARHWLRYLLGDADAARDPELIAAATARDAFGRIELSRMVWSIVLHPRFARNLTSEADR